MPVKRYLKGEAYLVRYADDFIIMFEHENEAIAVYEALRKRLAVFGLELAEDKTRILPFGRNSGTKDSFDFLGFLHINSKTRFGNYRVGHKISKKKRKMFNANLKKWVKENRNIEFDIFMNKLNRKLIGTNNYYAISGMLMEVRTLYNHAFWVVFKWLNRRSQRKSFTLEKFGLVWTERITPPHIHADIWGGNNVVYI